MNPLKTPTSAQFPPTSAHPHIRTSAPSSRRPRITSRIFLGLAFLLAVLPQGGALAAEATIGDITVTTRPGNISGSFNASVTSDLLLDINDSATILDIVNDKVLPEIVPQVVEDEGLNDSMELDDIVLANETMNVEIKKGTKLLGFKMPFTIKFCEVDIDVKIDEPRLRTDIPAEAFRFGVTGERKITTNISLPDTRLTGTLDLEVYAHCLGGFWILDAEPDVEIDGLEGSADIAFGFDDSSVTVEEISGLSVEFLDIDIETEELGWWKEVKTNLGLNHFMRSECDGYDDIEDCASAMATQEFRSQNQAINDLETALNESLGPAMTSILSLKAGAETGGAALDAELGMTDFTVSPLRSAWNGELGVSGTEYDCASGVELGDATGSIGDYASTGVAIEAVLPYNVPQLALFAAAKQGLLCLGIEYTDDDGNLWDGTLIPAGAITMATGGYEYELTTLSNWDSVSSFGASGGTASAVPTFAVAKRVAGTIAVRPDSEWTVTTETVSEEGLQADLPVRFRASREVAGVTVTLDAATTLHLAGRMESGDENELEFKIFQAWVDGFAGEVEALGYEGDEDDSDDVEKLLSDLTDEANKNLAAEFYLQKTRRYTYARCPMPNQYAVTVETTTDDCGSDCEVATGIEIGNLSAYGYTLTAVSWGYGDETLAVGLSTSHPDDDYATECHDFSFFPPEYDDSWIEDSQRFSEILHDALKGSTVTAEVRTEIARFLDKLDAILEMVIIDENPYPEEFLRAQTFEVMERAMTIVETNRYQTR